MQYKISNRLCFMIILVHISELLSLYCKLYQDPVNTVDRVVLARIIHMLVHGASAQCDIRPKRLLNFFTQTMKSVRYNLVYKCCAFLYIIVSCTEHMLLSINAQFHFAKLFILLIFILIIANCFSQYL